MLGIPSYPILLPLFAVFGFFAASTSIYSLIKGDEEESKEIFRFVMLTIVGTIFFLFGTIFSIGTFWSAYNFRSINISKVKEFRVIKSDDEYKNNNSNYVIFADTQSVQKALENFKNCSETFRDHESYQDGYKFQIIFADENASKDLYISVYRKNNNKQGKAVVIPHYYENKNLNLGEYSCPAFQDWVKANIDPLFQNENQFPK